MHKARNYWCDCIRGYAILVVCLAHLFHVTPLHDHFTSLALYLQGDAGVFMFYVLSGFLVTGILAREVNATDSFPLRLKAIGHFFGRRVFRLQPGYLLFLGIYILLPRQNSALSIGTLVLPISNWFGGPYITWHLKTLHIEEIYYLGIGVLSFIAARHLRQLLWFLLIAAPLGRIAIFLAVRLGHYRAEWWLATYMPVEAFAVGGILALQQDSVRNTRVCQYCLRYPGISFISALLGIVVVGAMRQCKPFSYAFVLTWPVVFAGLSAVMILVGLERKRFLFAPEWLRRIGLFSYSIYLFQQLVLGPWDQTYQTVFSWWHWLALLASVALGVPLWYKLAEMPLTNLGAKIFPRVSGWNKRGATAEVPRSTETLLGVESPGLPSPQ